VALYQTPTRPLPLLAYLTKSLPLRRISWVPTPSLPLCVHFLTSNLIFTHINFSHGCYFMNSMLWIGLATLSLLYYMETWYNISGACVKLFVIYPFHDSLIETSWWTVKCCLQCYFCDDPWRFLGISHLSWPWRNVMHTVPGARERGTRQAPFLV